MRAKKWAPRAHARSWSCVTGRVVICSRSPSDWRVRRKPRANGASNPRRGHDYSRGILRSRRASCVHALGIERRSGRCSHAAPGGASSTIAPRRSSTRVAARSSSISRPASACSQRLFQASRLASIARRPLGVRRETTTRRSVCERTRSTCPLLGQVVEHLRDRRRRQPRGGRQLAGRQLAPLEQLDQQLELSVAQLAGTEMRVAPAQAVEAAKHAAKRHAQLRQLRARLDLRLSCGSAAHRPWTPTRRRAARPPPPR